MDQKEYDMIIIGSGPAGLTSALYALRSEKTVLLIERGGIGGQAASSPLIENYPGLTSLSGEQLMQNMFSQLSEYQKFEFTFDDITDIKKENNIFTVVGSWLYRSKTVVIATGVQHKKLPLENNELLEQSGLSYCATCDGPLFHNKDVVIIGDANSAIQYFLMMKDIAKSVTLLSLEHKIYGEEILKNRFFSVIKTEEKAQWKIGSVDKINILENKKLEVCFNDQKIIADGVFVAIGQTPHNDFAKDLVDFDSKGFIITDENCETKTQGLFAAGDCRSKNTPKQVIISAADGCVASLKAMQYLY